MAVNEQRKLVYVVMVLAVAALIVSAVAIFLLYRTAIESAHAQLSATVRSQARLIEAVGRYDLARGASASPNEIPDVTLGQIEDSFRRYEGIGRTGEFVLARRDGDDIVVLVRQRSDAAALAPPRRIPFRGTDAEPMRRALSGKSGTMIGRDYRGREVLAAYEPVDGWNLGIVAKMDLAEIRAPFVRTGAVTGGMAVVTVLLCALAVLRATKPIIRRVQDSETRYRSVIAAMAEGVVIQGPDQGIVTCNPGAERILGLSADQMAGRTSLDPRWHAIHEDGSPFPGETHPAAVTLRTGQPQSNVVMGVHRPDGSLVWISINSQPLIHSGETRPHAVVTSFIDITEHVLAEQALRQSEDRLRKIFDASSMIISVSRLEDGRFVDVNPEFLRVGGWTREEVIGRTSFEVNVWVGAEDRARLVERMRREGAVHDLELAFRMKSGEVRHLLCAVQQIRIEDVDCLLLVGQDITERKRAESQMQKLSRALEQTADVVQIADRDGIIEYVNPTFERVTGYSSAEAVGRKSNLLKSGRQSAGFYENLWKTILAGDVFSDVFINRRKDGSLYYEEKTITPLKDADGRISHFVATGKDITERVQTQERLAYMAQHDPLTELPNRTLLLDRLKQSLAGARWHNRRVAVLFVDLDRFKTINDTLGHEVGDRLLQQLAGRFQQSVREGDTVARFGGDEFVIMLDDIAAEDDIVNVAQKVLEALTPPFEVDHQTLYVTASIGVSLFPNDGEDASTLLKNADIAMYRAKELGKNTYQFYSADMSARAFERLTLESSLRRALDQGEFRLYYQPQVDVETGGVIGVEALLRWQHPEFGLVMPTDFISLLEETGLIVPAGDWVLQTACAQLAAWHAQGWRQLRLAVNLSPRQFQGQDLTAVVKRALTAFDGEPGRLELEITEGVLVRHAPAAVEALEALHALGVQMAVDDFGTGYSSLSYLRRLPIDSLKIDRAFVRDIPHDPDDSAIASAIIALAQSLKLEMIAEGVENAAQRDFLRAQGCRVMQGYLFGRPQPPEGITRLLQAQKPR